MTKPIFNSRYHRFLQIAIESTSWIVINSVKSNSTWFTEVLMMRQYCSELFTLLLPKKPVVVVSFYPCYQLAICFLTSPSYSPTVFEVCVSGPPKSLRTSQYLVCNLNIDFAQNSLMEIARKMGRKNVQQPELLDLWRQRDRNQPF